MPIHYEVLYFNYTGDDDCDEKSDLSAELVQNNITERELDDESSTQYIDWINIHYTKDTAGNFPAAGSAFKLTLEKNGYAIDTSPSTTVTEPRTGGTAATLSFNDQTSQVELSFEPPLGAGSDDNTTTVFEFGTGTPGTKLKVKVKKQTGFFTC